MNYEEMLLAVHVRELAKGFRNAAATQEKRAANNQDAYNDYLAAFAQAHPVNEYVPQAMQALEKTCEAMRAYVSTPRQQAAPQAASE